MPTEDSVIKHIRCSQCKKLNRIYLSRRRGIWKCGACKATLSTDLDFVSKETAQPDKPTLRLIFQLMLFALVLLPASIAAGFLEYKIQSISQEWLDLQILVYPGMAAGALVGFIIVLCKRPVMCASASAVPILAFCAGLIVVGSRWEIEASNNSPPLGIIEYISKEATTNSELHFAGGHHIHGHSHMTPMMFWFLFVVEGVATVLATMRIANEAPL